MPTLWGYKEDYVTRNWMSLKCFGTFEKQDPVLKSRKHLLWCEPVSVDRNRHYCFFLKVLFSVIVTGKRLRGLGAVGRKSRNFSGAFRWHNSLCIFKTKAYWGTKLCSYFYFYSFYDIWKDQLYRINRPEFYEWLFGPEKLSGLSRHGPLVLRAPYLCVWLIEFLGFFFWRFFFFFLLFCCCFSFSWTCWVVSNRLRDKRIFFPLTECWWWCEDEGETWSVRLRSSQA